MNKLKALYDKLSSDGLYTKTFEEFQAQFSSPSSQQKLYEKLSADGLYTKSSEDFQNQFFSQQATQFDGVAGPSMLKKKGDTRSVGQVIGDYQEGLASGSEDGSSESAEKPKLTEEQSQFLGGLADGAFAGEEGFEPL